MMLSLKQTGARYGVSRVRRGKSCLLRGAALAALTLLSAGAFAQAAPKEVALTAGSCPVVSDGDIVTFDWNPAFTMQSDVRGLAELALGFARDLPAERGRGITPPLRLEAQLRTYSRAAEGSAITGESNGSYHIRFYVHSLQLPAGTYDLVRASAVAKVDATEPGERPQMTNSPLQSHFCLTLTAAPPRRSGL